MSKEKSDIESVKLLILKTINNEQKEHSRIISELSNKIGGTNEFENVSKLLSKLYESKIDVLEKLYEEIKNI